MSEPSTMGAQKKECNSILYKVWVAKMGMIKEEGKFGM